jgi:hypothetical protein
MERNAEITFILVLVLMAEFGFDIGREKFCLNAEV